MREGRVPPETFRFVYIRGTTTEEEFNGILNRSMLNLYDNFKKLLLSFAKGVTIPADGLAASTEPTVLEGTWADPKNPQNSEFIFTGNNITVAGITRGAFEITDHTFTLYLTEVRPDTASTWAKLPRVSDPVEYTYRFADDGGLILGYDGKEFDPIYKK
jgi:hypothetical protein